MLSSCFCYFCDRQYDSQSSNRLVKKTARIAVSERSCHNQLINQPVRVTFP